MSDLAYKTRIQVTFETLPFTFPTFLKLAQNVKKWGVCFEISGFRSPGTMSKLAI